MRNGMRLGHSESRVLDVRSAPAPAFWADVSMLTRLGLHKVGDPS